MHFMYNRTNVYACNSQQWDEPPSGASEIQRATPEMHQRAEHQLSHMMATIDEIPPDPAQPDPPAEAKAPPRKKGFLGGIFAKKNKKEPPQPPKRRMDDGTDLELQRAIQMSLNDTSGGGGDPGDMDDGLAMAKALSLSEAQGTAPLTEEEQIQIALAESQREAGGDADMLGVTGAAVPNMMTDDSENSMNQKMPAKNTSASASPVASFDPYAASNSTTPTAEAATGIEVGHEVNNGSASNLHKLESEESELDRKKPARGFLRKIRGKGSQRMENEAGLL